ncbi:hypothetical protein BH10BAC5_BH10BAC5_08700 [soil metagenome]
MKTIIIDGNNLIHKIEKFKSIFAKDKFNAQAALSEAIKTRIPRTSKVIIVYDGHSDKKISGSIYSGIKTADEVIRQYIEENYNRLALLVVSSDKGITNLAELCGCEVKRSEDFWKEIDKEVKTLTKVPNNANINHLLEDGSEKPDRISKKDINEFKKYFT